jgi:hypothetical protein
MGVSPLRNDRGVWDKGTKSFIRQQVVERKEALDTSRLTATQGELLRFLHRKEH